MEKSERLLVQGQEVVQLEELVVLNSLAECLEAARAVARE